MKLGIKNFRSVQDQEIDLGRITVLYGPNGAGKSSLLYALLTLKNVFLNPTQNSSSFFGYGFVNLGGFDSVVFDHRARNQIELALKDEFPCSIGAHDGRSSLVLKAGIRKDSGVLSLSAGVTGVFPEVDLTLDVPFPYPGNQQAQQSVGIGESSYTVTWNGVRAQVQAPSTEVEIRKTAEDIAVLFDDPVHTLSSISFVPLKRGFSKFQYSSVPMSPGAVTEDEVATLLSTNKILVSRVSHYFERILEREFRVNVTPGTAVFTLDSTDKTTGVSSELVNDGFGANQIVYVLAKCLGEDVRWVCLEEPEIHLHPTAIRNFARAVVDISREEDKRFVISTHSEFLLTALLVLVEKGELQADDLACYFARKDKKVTSFERQTVNQNGQIEGGLTSFIEAELEDLKSLQKVTS
ncbi:MAG: AAA family ATPase [Candidatus Zixiibacteriota bacterium]